MQQFCKAKPFFSLFLLLVLLYGCGFDQYWERTLLGPFNGQLFVETIDSKPKSTLTLSKELKLEVHFENGKDHPVVCLRTHEDELVWAMALIPQLKTEDKPRGKISRIDFTDMQPVGDGKKVFFTCDWTGGGNERGIIYLGPDFAFRSFALGW